MNEDQAKAELSKAISNYNPESQEGSSKDFELLANGIFQSEGSVSARFRKDKWSITPVVSVGQIFSSESLAFFVRLFF